MNFKKIIELVPTDDSADEGEQLLLYSLIRALKPKTVVETGTHRGHTTLYLAQALKENQQGHIHTCDPYDWQQEKYFALFPDLEPYITYHRVRGDVLDVKDIDFLFIDGLHEKEEVEREIDHLFPLLTENAVVVFHDCGYPPNPLCDVNGAVLSRNLKTVWLPTHNKLRIYEHSSI